MLKPVESDIYAKGMVYYGEAEAESTPTYDRWQYGLFKKFLGRKILEVGAGAGRMTALLIEDGNFDNLVASEPSEHFYRLLSQKLPSAENIKLLQATTTDLLPEYRSYFDATFSTHVMEHIEDDRQFLQEQLELVRPGGRVIVLVPALQFLYSELDRNIGHFRRYDKERMRTLVRGLKNCRIRTMSYSNALGVLGSLYFSKIRKINYQTSEQSRRNFFRIYRFFSEHVVPVVKAVESKIPVPIGLNLMVVLEKSLSGAASEL